jgi:hypothetical protein
MALSMITTRIFSSTKKDLFRVMFLRYLRYRWWVLLLIIVLGGGSSVWSSGGQGPGILLALIFLVAFPLLISYSIWRYLSAPGNDALYMKKHYEMDLDEIRHFAEDGSMSATPVGSFIKTELIAGHYLLYLGKNQYFLVPTGCFETKDDLQWFRENMLAKINARQSR